MYLQEDSLLRPFFAGFRSGRHANRVIGPDPEENVFVSVRLRGRLRLFCQSSGAPVGHRQYLSRKVFAETHAASDADMEQVAQFGRAHGLRVVEGSAVRRTIVLAGPVKQMSRAFRAQFGTWKAARADGRDALRMIQISADLLELVESVQELENHRRYRSLPCEGENQCPAESFCLRAGYLA